MAHEEHRLTGTRETAKALGVCGLTLRTWARDGKVPYYRTAEGHRPRFLFDLAEVRAALAKGEPARVP